MPDKVAPPALLTDRAEARRFVDAFADRVRYIPLSDEWFFYDGQNWHSGLRAFQDVFFAVRASITPPTEKLARIKNAVKRAKYRQAINGRSEPVDSILKVIHLSGIDPRTHIPPEAVESLLQSNKPAPRQPKTRKIAPTKASREAK